MKTLIFAIWCLYCTFVYSQIPDLTGTWKGTVQAMGKYSQIELQNADRTKIIDAFDALAFQSH